MKKNKIETFGKIVALSTFLSMCSPIGDNFVCIETVQASGGIEVLVNGNRISFEDADPFVEDGRTMVPLRGVFEAMGFSVNWYSDVWSGSSEDLQSLYGTTNPELIGINTSTNVVQGGDISVLKDNTIMQSGSVVETDKDPVLIGGRYYLPLRVIAENTGAVVGWNQDTKTVTIDFTAVPVVQDQAVVEDSLGVGYTGRWGDASYASGNQALLDQYGHWETLNMDNYSHKAYFKNAPEGNGVVPTGAYYIQTDNALAGAAVYSTSLGGVQLPSGAVYIGEYQSSVEGKFGKPDRVYDDDGCHQYKDIGLNVYYTSSGRVKQINIRSTESNNFANQGFTYGNSTLALGSTTSLSDYTLNPGEKNNGGSIMHNGLMFGTDLCIYYSVNNSNGVWTSYSITAIPSGTSDLDTYDDPF